MLNPDSIDVEDLTINENVVEDPVEILVDLAAKGEIDPWNVDIVAVTDKFMKRLEGARKLDLRNSGRTLFYAAVLLRMKADALSVWEEQEEIADTAEPDFIVPFEQIVIPRLRRTSSRRVTLQELIDSLREAESIAMKKGERLRKDVKMITEDILRIPHEEDNEVMLKRVVSALDVKFASDDVISLSELLTYIGGREVEKSTAILIFLSLLFVATKEKNILLEQEKLFGELYIRKKEAKKAKLAEACNPA